MRKENKMIVVLPWEEALKEAEENEYTNEEACHEIINISFTSWKRLVNKKIVFYSKEEDDVYLLRDHPKYMIYKKFTRRPNLFDMVKYYKKKIGF